MMRDDWTNIENAVDRTEAAVIEEAIAIATQATDCLDYRSILKSSTYIRSKERKIIRKERLHATDIVKFFNN